MKQDKSLPPRFLVVFFIIFCLVLTYCLSLSESGEAHTDDSVAVARERDAGEKIRGDASDPLVCSGLP